MQHVEQLNIDPDAAPALPTNASTAASSTEPASGHVDGSVASLQSGHGNLPLHLKLELAHHLGSFNP